MKLKTHFLFLLAILLSYWTFSQESVLIKLKNGNNIISHSIIVKKNHLRLDSSVKVQLKKISYIQRYGGDSTFYSIPLKKYRWASHIYNTNRLQLFHVQDKPDFNNEGCDLAVFDISESSDAYLFAIDGGDPLTLSTKNLKKHFKDDKGAKAYLDSAKSIQNGQDISLALIILAPVEMFIRMGHNAVAEGLDVMTLGTLDSEEETVSLVPITGVIGLPLVIINNSQEKRKRNYLMKAIAHSSLANVDRK